MEREDRILKQFDFTRRGGWVPAFYDFSIVQFERLLRRRGEEFWQGAGERRALRIFHEAAERVPAYKDFLKKRGVRHERVKTIKDFAQAPITDKKNYVTAYSFKDRSWDGDVSRSLVAMSSGTSGNPTFWPRGGYQEFEAAVTHELLYRYLFQIEKYKTLLIIGFPMGVYVSGVATLIPSWLVSQKGYPVSLVAVGNNKDEILRALRHLRGDYEQVVLAGHPFFIKDVIETGRRERVSWRGKRLRTLFCSEGVNETWRKFVLKGASDAAAFNTYGSSEFLLMGFETPFSIAVRERLPEPDTVCFQYNPFLRFVENIRDEFIFTSASGVPLIRFNLHDAGFTFSFAKAKELLGSAVKSVRAPLWDLPLISLSGRSDQTMIFYAANIYPENVRAALQHKKFLRSTTGKFSMRKGYLKNMDEFLEINIELVKGAEPTKKFVLTLQKHIVASLRKMNAEYSDVWSHLNKDLSPRIKLWPYGHPKYFKPGLKPRYISSL